MTPFLANILASVANLSTTLLAGKHLQRTLFERRAAHTMASTHPWRRLPKRMAPRPVRMSMLTSAYHARAGPMGLCLIKQYTRTCCLLRRSSSSASCVRAAVTLCRAAASSSKTQSDQSRTKAAAKESAP